eukprot:TRINITY_DN6849_c0_g1_i3.p1 TRINITY_DN6849_c0_g1~~TRINITY_DN6849_c0_g1_i3.p1  ORF type:complete len:761 (-),score=148.74 TRINITY_DN6849_c0_g1_i3:1053-3335(-)
MDTPRHRATSPSIELPWLRLQTTQQRAAALRMSGVEVLRPSLDNPNQRSPRIKKHSPRTLPQTTHERRPREAASAPLSLLLPHLNSHANDEFLRETARTARSDSLVHFDQFRSGVVGLEVKVKEVIQRKAAKDYNSKYPSPDHVQALCECFYEASMISSSIQQSLKLLYPEIVRAIFSISGANVPDVRSLHVYAPYVMQVHFLEMERQELREQIQKLQAEIAGIAQKAVEQKKELDVIIVDLQQSIGTRDSQIRKLQDDVEAAKMHGQLMSSEADKYRALYRNGLDHYEEDLSRALEQESEKYSTKLTNIEQEKKAALVKLNTMKEDIDMLKQEIQRMVPLQTHDELKRLLIMNRFELHVARDQIENLKKIQQAIRSRAIEEIKRREDRIEANKMSFLEEISKRTPRPEWTEIFPEEDDRLYQLDLNLASESSSYGKIMLLRQHMIHIYEDMNTFKAICAVQIEKEKDMEPFEADKFIVCQGTTPDVPKYLRIAGKIKKRRISKRDTESLVKDVWKDRSVAIKAMGSKGQKLKFGEYFYSYLQTHYGLHNVVVEWAYNIIEALEKYSYDGDCHLFLKTLRGEISDEAHDDQMTMIENLRATFMKVDTTIHGKETGRIPRKELFAALNKFFILKPPDKMNSIRGSLLHEQPGLNVYYHKLFEEDRDGNQGPFIETIRDQYLQEIVEFSADIETGLEALCKKGSCTLADVTEYAAKTFFRNPSSMSSFSLDGPIVSFLSFFFRCFFLATIIYLWPTCRCFMK